MLVVGGLCYSSWCSSRSAAAVPATAPTNTVARSYDAGAGVLAGMLVRSESDTKPVVVPLASQNIKQMLGVVVPVADANIVLTPPAASGQQVLVAGAGRYQLLVSSQKGAIKAGDYLTVSALDGIATRAGTDAPQVVGRAVADFDGKAGVIDTEQLKSTFGRTTTVAIGHIPADIQLGPNPFYRKNGSLPSFLADAASSVAHKDVKPFRVYLSLTVLLTTLCITGFMLYGGMRGGIIAVGRNPLARGAISRGLIKVVLFSLIVFLAGVFGAYTILI